MNKIKVNKINVNIDEARWVNANIWAADLKLHLSTPAFDSTILQKFSCKVTALRLVMRISQREKNVRHYTNSNIFYTFTILMQGMNNIPFDVIAIFYALSFPPYSVTTRFMFLEFVKDEA